MADTDPLPRTVVDKSKATQYSLLNKIGTGQGATVYRAKVISAANQAEEYVAILIIDTHHPESNNLINAMLKNKNQASSNNTLVKVLDSTFTVNNILHMIMPYFSGSSLLSIMTNRFQNGIEVHFIGLILKHVTYGLCLLHGNLEFHRDIGCSRIFIDTRGSYSVMLAYAATIFQENGMPQTHFTWRTPPELLAPQPPDYNEKMDVWYIGITAFELAFGGAHCIPVFNHQDLFRMVKDLQNTSPLPPLKIYIDVEEQEAKRRKITMPLQSLACLEGKKITVCAAYDQAYASFEQRKITGPHFWEMIAWCLNPDNGNRPTAHDLFLHPFFLKNKLEASYLMRLTYHR